MKRDYQFGFSEKSDSMFKKTERERKAKTMIAALNDYFDQPLTELTLLNVGGSSGIIDNYLAEHFKHVTGIDIDQNAIDFAQENFHRDNLHFQIGDALNMPFSDQTFDVAICSQVYEHVPDANLMMKEIYRVLKPGGVCYFAAGNRLMWNEPHYNLPLLSVIPRPLAHKYLNATRGIDYYHELHLTYWGLKKLVNNFTIHDYTKKMINTPEKYKTSYMIKNGSHKQKIAKIICKYIYWIVPGYVWLLEK